MKFKLPLKIAVLLVIIFVIKGTTVVAANLNSGQEPSSSIDTQSEENNNKIIMVYAQSSKALINGVLSSIDSQNKSVAPVIKNGRLLIPLRFLANELGSDVTWDEGSQTAEITTENRDVITLSLGKNILNINGIDSTESCEPELINGKLMVPVRPISEAMGMKVDYIRGLILISNKEQTFTSEEIEHYISVLSMESGPIYKTAMEICQSTTLNEDINNNFKYITTKYPQLVSELNIGKINNNTDLMVLKLGKGKRKILLNYEENKGEFYLSLLSLNHIQMLVDAYERKTVIEGIDINKLLSESSIYFLPISDSLDTNFKRDVNEETIKLFIKQYNFNLIISYNTGEDGCISWNYANNNANAEESNIFVQKLAEITGYTLLDQNNRTSLYNDLESDTPVYSIEVAKVEPDISSKYKKYDEIWKENICVPFLGGEFSKEFSGLGDANKTNLIINQSLVKSKEVLVKDGRSYISVDELSKYIGKKNAENKIEITNINVNAEFVYNSRIVSINNIPVVTSMFNIIYDGKFYIPIKSLQEALGLSVQWDEVEKIVHIKEPYNIPKNSTVEKLFPPTIVKGTIVSEGYMYNSIDGKTIKTLNLYEDIEVLRDSNYAWYFIKDKTGIEGWVRANSISIASNYTPNKDIPTNDETEFFVKYKGYNSNTDYLVFVDLNRERVNIMKLGGGSWKIYKTFLCATGKNISPTIKGNFKINDSRGTWMPAGGNIWVKNYVGFYPRYYFHSIKVKSDGSVYDATIGVPASAGCIRIPLDESKWFYDNIPIGTGVYIY